MRYAFISIFLFGFIILVLIFLFRRDQHDSNFFIETYEIPEDISVVEVLDINNKLPILIINKQSISSIEISDSVKKGILFRVIYDDGDIVVSEFHIIKPGMTMVLEFNSNRNLYCKIKNADFF